MFLAGVRGACAREIQYLKSHPWDSALISWVPALTLMAIWAIFSAGVNTKLPMAFVDEDHSEGSRHLAIALEATRSTAITEWPASLDDAWTLARQRRVYAILQVPRDWQRRAERGDPLPVVLYTNEQFHAAGSSIANDVLGAVSSIAGGRALAGLAALGGGFEGAQWRASAVHAELRTLYGPQLSFERALTGAFLPTTLHLFVLGGAAFAIIIGSLLLPISTNPCLKDMGWTGSVYFCRFAKFFHQKVALPGGYGWQFETRERSHIRRFLFG